MVWEYHEKTKHKTRSFFIVYPLKKRTKKTKTDIKVQDTGEHEGKLYNGRILYGP